MLYIIHLIYSCVFNTVSITYIYIYMDIYLDIYILSLEPCPLFRVPLPTPKAVSMRCAVEAAGFIQKAGAVGKG